MDGRVRRANLQLDRAMMGRGAHIGIIDVASFVKDDYMTDGLHLKFSRQEEADTSD
jgi:hypothetical protein